MSEQKGRSLRVLIVEDSTDDAEMLALQLRYFGFGVTYERVETRAAMREALTQGSWDIVLSDFNLPSFNASHALDVLKESGQDLPFIVVSGTIGEDTAAALMKQGAHDFFLKNKLVRLGPAVERELVEASNRAEKARIEQARLKLIQYLEQALRARDDFLILASHELRTPLTVLQFQHQGLLRALQKNGDLEGRDRLVQGLHRGSRQIARLIRLVESMLAASPAKDLPLQLGFREIDLVELVRSVVLDFEEELSRVGCTVAIHGEAPVTGHWDPSYLEDALAHLLLNSIKFASEKPIEITVSARAGIATLAVRDFGMGIAPEDQERIFLRFERAVSLTHFGGLGLGLYISRRIIEAHGGTMSVTSEVGAGATFIIHLPIDPPFP